MFAPERCRSGLGVPGYLLGAVLRSTWYQVKQGGILANKIKWSQEDTGYTPLEATVHGQVRKAKMADNRERKGPWLLARGTGEC